MVRTASLRSLRGRILRFTTPGDPGAVAACYVALLAITTAELPPASHQDLQGTLAACSTIASSGEYDIDADEYELQLLLRHDSDPLYKRLSIERDDLRNVCH